MYRICRKMLHRLASVGKKQLRRYISLIIQRVKASEATAAAQCVKRNIIQ